MTKPFTWYGNLSLRTKILVPFVLVFMVESLVAALLMGSSFQQDTYQQAHTNLRSLASLSAQSLQDQAQVLGQQATLMATQADFAGALADRDASHLTRFITGVWWARPPGFVGVIDKRHSLIASMMPNSLLQQPPRPLAGIITALPITPFSSVVCSEDQEAVFIVGSAPISSSRGAPLGSLVIARGVDGAALAELNAQVHARLSLTTSRRAVASTFVASQRPSLGDVRPPRDSGLLVDSAPVHTVMGPSLWLQAATSSAPVRASAATAWKQAWVVCLLGIGAATLTALLTASRLTRRLRRLAEMAGNLRVGDRHARAPEGARDEIGQLGGALNGMADELSERSERLADAFEEMRRLSERDGLTGLFNRRTVEALLDEEVDRALAGGGLVTLMMLDIDDFKLLNDTYGHLAGDRVLRQVAEHLAKVKRASDQAGRFGGDEFVLVMPGTGVRDAAHAAERLRGAQAAHPFVAPDGRSIPVRLSIGLAELPAHAQDRNELVAQADASLYASKRKGGDCVALSEEWCEAAAQEAAGFGMLESLVAAVDNKDSYTRRHSDEVTAYALSIADQLRLSPQTQDALRVAGLLHDVGKIGVPDRVLRKRGSLSSEETQAMRRHPTLGQTIISSIPNLEEVREAVASHHERFDGNGYPKGLAGERIPLLGRVLAVADAYSAMTTDRPYRAALKQSEALAEIRRHAGSQFDPQVIDAFLSVIELERLVGGKQTLTFA